MTMWLRSSITAVTVWAVVQACTVGFIAPNLSRRVAGAPAVREERILVREAAPTLTLVNNSGSINVATHKGAMFKAEAEVTIYTWERHMGAEAAAYATELFSLERQGDTLVLLTERGDRPEALEVFVDYQVHVPEGTNIEIQSDNGNVQVQEGCGAVTVSGGNADVEVRKPRGPVTARSTNGRIRVWDAPGETLVETANGNIYAHMLGGALTARTTNGAVVARLLRPGVRRCDLTTKNGGITVILPQHGSAMVHAQTGRGVVRTDYAVDISAGGIVRRHHVEGTIGEGLTELQMDTLNGNIWVTGRSRG